MLLTMLLACQRTPPPPAAPPLLSYIEVRTADAGDDAPVVVAMHGLGDSPEGFQGLLGDFPLPARFILPAGPIPYGGGFSWYPYPPADDAARAADLGAAADRVAALIASLSSEPVAITGFSQGGMLSFALAAQHPAAVSAAVPISGTLPPPLWPSDRLAPVEVTALHGTADSRVPMAGAQEATAALVDVGQDAVLIPYDGVGHTVSREMRLDLYLALADAIGEPLPGVQSCPLLTTAVTDQQLSVPMQTAAGERALPVGALLRPSRGRCPEGMAAAEVVSIDPLLQPETPVRVVAVGDGGCIDPAHLTPLAAHELIPHPAVPGIENPFPADTVIAAGLETACGSNRYGRLPVSALSHLRPVTAEMKAAAEAVRAAWPAALGEAPAVAVSAWGYVQLPLPHPLTAAEIAAEWEREGLQTEEQREKGTTALGPVVDGEPIYTHFTGADARHSDAWGTAGAVAALVELAWGWRGACVAAGWSPRQCTLQVGDLAWYSPRRPDPLGHAEHYAGQCADVRLFREDGSRYEAYWNQTDDRIREGSNSGYSAALTQAFLSYATQHHPVSAVYFNDPDVSVPGIERRPGHDDHIHLCFDP